MTKSDRTVDEIVEEFKSMSSMVDLGNVSDAKRLATQPPAPETRKISDLSGMFDFPNADLTPPTPLTNDKD